MEERHVTVLRRTAVKRMEYEEEVFRARGKCMPREGAGVEWIEREEIWMHVDDVDEDRCVCVMRALQRIKTRRLFCSAHERCFSEMSWMTCVLSM